MKTIDLIYLFVALLVASPYIQIRVAEGRRARALRRLERARGARVVAIVHRQETVAVLGLPFFRFATVTLPEEALAALARIPSQEPLDLVVHLPGGVGLDTARVAGALRTRSAPTSLVVPGCALSGCLELARAADDVALGPGAVVGDTAGAPLGLAELRAAGIDARAGVDDAVWPFLALCPQPPRRRPSPLYLPLTRGGRALPVAPHEAPPTDDAGGL